MATIKAAYGTNDKRVVVTWAGIANGDTIQAHEVRGKPEFATVQFEGSFSNATVGLEGSISGNQYETLRDISNTAISSSANAMFSVLDTGIYFKPSFTSSASDTVDVTFVYWVR